MSTALVKYEEARRALALCARIDEVKPWQDKAAGMAAYAKQANDPELLIYAQKIRLQAQRRAGEILIKLADTGERVTKDSGGDRRSVGRKVLVKLEDLGVSNNQSKRWQRIAKLPEKEFDGWLRDVEDRLRGRAPKPKRVKIKPGSEKDEDDGGALERATFLDRCQHCTAAAIYPIPELGGIGLIDREVVAAAERTVNTWSKLLRRLKEGLKNA